jgi:hypothetical protein
MRPVRERETSYSKSTSGLHCFNLKDTSYVEDTTIVNQHITIVFLELHLESHGNRPIEMQVASESLSTSRETTTTSQAR